MNKEKEKETKDDQVVSLLLQIKEELAELKEKLEKQLVDKKQE